MQSIPKWKSLWFTSNRGKSEWKFSMSARWQSFISLVKSSAKNVPKQIVGECIFFFIDALYMWINKLWEARAGFQKQKQWLSQTSDLCFYWCEMCHCRKYIVNSVWKTLLLCRPPNPWTATRVQRWGYRLIGIGLIHPSCQCLVRQDVGFPALFYFKAFYLYHTNTLNPFMLPYKQAALKPVQWFKRYFAHKQTGLMCNMFRIA